MADNKQILLFITNIKKTLEQKNVCVISTDQGDKLNIPLEKQGNPQTWKDILEPFDLLVKMGPNAGQLTILKRK